MIRSSAEELQDELVPDGTCSYCGGINPDLLFKILDNVECTITPTDKSYKAYLDVDSKPRAKIYFQHFTDAHIEKFLQMYNEKKLKLGYPHHFYVLPFFAQSEAVAVPKG